MSEQNGGSGVVMFQGDLESLVDFAYRQAGVDAPQVTPLALAKALGIRVEVVPNLYALGCLATVNGVRTIAVRASLSPADRQHTIGHELGHLLLSWSGLDRRDHQEDWCDFIGGAMVARRSVFLGLVHKPLTTLAHTFRTSETLVALRRAEVTGEPVAVVTPDRVRARGEAEWPDECTLRKWVRRPAIGVRVARLSDDPSRALVVPPAKL